MMGLEYPLAAAIYWLTLVLTFGAGWRLRKYFGKDGKP